MKKQPRVLVIAQTNDHNIHLLDQHLQMFKNLSYNEYELHIVDSSTERKNSKKIRKHGINAEWIEPKNKTQVELTATSQDIGRDFALRYGYEYLLQIKIGVMPPANIIEQLLFHKKEIVSACYFEDHGHNSKLAIQLLEAQGEIIRETQNMDYGIGDMTFMDGTLKQVYGAGLGCTLIHKSVFEKIQFRNIEKTNAGSDVLFYADTNALGVKQFVDTGILCEHENNVLEAL